MYYPNLLKECPCNYLVTSMNEQSLDKAAWDFLEYKPRYTHAIKAITNNNNNHNNTVELVRLFLTK
jgi:hypothetical protein